MFCWGILTIAFALRCFLILSLISILAGLVAFSTFCTLGVGLFAIGLSIVTVWFGVVVLALWIGVLTLGLGTNSLGCISCGGLVVWSNVTRFDVGIGCSLGIGAISGTLLSMFSNFSNPFALLFPFNACVRSLMALVMTSAGVMVGCVMYFVLKNTVSDTRSLFVYFT